MLFLAQTQNEENTEANIKEEASSQNEKEARVLETKESEPSSQEEKKLPLREKTQRAHRGQGSVNVRYLVATAMLGALAAALMHLQFPIPIVPGFLKFDFSELPALIASFSMGPLSGVAVCLIKNAVHLPVSTTFCVGELSNFLLGVALVLPAGLWYRMQKNRAGALWGSLCGTLCMGICSFPINYFITYPVYAVAFIPGATLEQGMEAIIGMYRAILPWADTLPECLLVFNLPFTMAKGLADAGITFLLYKHISRLIKGNKKEK